MFQCFQQEPALAGAPAGTLLRIAGCIPAFSIRGKGALGAPLISLGGSQQKGDTYFKSYWKHCVSIKF